MPVYLVISYSPADQFSPETTGREVRQRYFLPMYGDLQKTDLFQKTSQNNPAEESWVGLLQNPYL